MARDRKVKLPVSQLLVYPIAGTDFDTPSYTENANAKPLNKAMMQWFFKQYLKSADDAHDPRLSLVNADLHGMPPTTLVIAEIDPLRSEGELLGKRLEAAGVKVRSKTYPGVTHEFFGMGAAVAEAKDAEAFAAEGLRKSFAKAPRPMGRRR